VFEDDGKDWHKVWSVFAQPEGVSTITTFRARFHVRNN